MIALWAELDLVVADEFRDGNVPAKQAPLTCAQTAFATLPASVKTRYFRGDSACHENKLIEWLRAPERGLEAGGEIGFAISAVLSADLAKAVAAVAEKEWKTLSTETDGTLRQWAEVVFVPGAASEKKESKPLRYVGLRLLKPQGVVTFEFHHLKRLIDGCQFDTIYHEHFSYLSLTAVETILAAAGLAVFDVEEHPTHGGSLRVFAQRSDTGTHGRTAAVEAVRVGLRTAFWRASLPGAPPKRAPICKRSVRPFRSISTASPVART